MNLASFDLNLLLVLEALLVERSATRAGKRVGPSQLAVSNALARLRTALGDPLFVRGRGAMTPTAFALSLAVPLRDALDGLRSALGRPPVFDPGRSAYHARFAATEYGEMVVLAPLARSLRAAVTLECKRLPAIYETPIAALERGEVEFVLSHAGRIPPAHGLRSAPLLTDRWAVLSSRRIPRTLARVAASPQVNAVRV